MSGEFVFSVALLAAVILEVLKFVVRKFVLKNPEYDFPRWFYIVALPVLNFTLVPLLALLGFDDYSFPADWSAWALELVRIVIMSVTSSLAFNFGVKPLRDYRPQ